MRELAVPMRRTEPQLCTLGSISGPSASVDSSQGSSRRRSSRVMSRSGRWPVAQTISLDAADLFEGTVGVLTHDRQRAVVVAT